jgi:hypothetical protein
MSPCLAFAQIHTLHNFGQFKLLRSIINVPTNIDQTQNLLPHLLKRWHNNWNITQPTFKV